VKRWSTRRTSVPVLCKSTIAIEDEKVGFVISIEIEHLENGSFDAAGEGIPERFPLPFDHPGEQQLLKWLCGERQTQ